MIDVHSHLIPNIDDGVQSFEEAKNTLKKLENLEFEKIIITPHYIRGTAYNKNNLEKYQLLLKLKEIIKKENINLELFLGNEIFLDENILNELKNGNCCSLNSGKYVLIEIPRNDEILKLDEIIFELKNKGLVPIMAHPERYMVIKQNYEILDKWLDQGMILQINYESILGKYGKESEKLVKYILKNNKASLIGTDIHHEDSMFFNNFLKCKKKIIKLIGEEKFMELTEINPEKILNNKDI